MSDGFEATPRMPTGDMLDAMRVAMRNPRGGEREMLTRIWNAAVAAMPASQPPTVGVDVSVSRELLEQIYGMAREGCEAPSAAYRWCERIDEVFHDGEPSPEYTEYAQPLPDAALRTGGGAS